MVSARSSFSDPTALCPLKCSAEKYRSFRHDVGDGDGGFGDDGGNGSDGGRHGVGDGDDGLVVVTMVTVTVVLGLVEVMIVIKVQ